MAGRGHAGGDDGLGDVALARHSEHVVALGGFSAMLLARVLAWEELLAERSAWDALIWFAPLIMMSDVLNERACVKSFSGKLLALMGGWPWPAALVALVVAYLYIHYSFASMTAHITALYPGFFAAALAAGAPPMAGRAAAGVFLQSRRRHHPLRHRLGARYSSAPAM